MDMICLTIDMRATGENIHQMMRQNGYCVHDVQTAMGFEYPQAVYKWLNGKTLPSVDNLMILSMLFHKSINDILVTTGGGAFLFVRCDSRDVFICHMWLCMRLCGD